MNVVTLRVQGEDATLAFLIGKLGLNIDASWKRGESGPRGREHQSSGFNATIADADNTQEMLRGIREFLAKCKASQLSFVADGLLAELAIGVTVGDSEQFVAFVELSSSELTLLGSLGVALSFAAYPTSNEAG